MMQEIQVDDRPARSYLALPEGVSGPWPAVLVLHAWWGLTDMFTGVCDRLAAAGFIAFAPDLYDGPTATTIADAERLMEESDGARSRAIALAAIAHLREHATVRDSPIGVVGFSMGANWAFHLSVLRSEDIAAVVAFYGGTMERADFASARAAYLGHFAERDDFEPLEAVRALEEQIRDGGREVTFHIYPGTGHWFFEGNRPDAYDAEAARLAWERTVTFLQRTLTAR
jgi:carboxymethylenebutenolidase